MRQAGTWLSQFVAAAEQGSGFTAVTPEPSSMVLLLCGGLMIGLARKRL